jgi:hypothetical protein
MITLTREEAQQVLDSLRAVEDLTTHDDEVYAAIDIIEPLLAQPEPEPVACPKEPENIEELYTAPPQREWQGLTDEEIMDACAAVWASHPIDVGRIIEAKLKEKNASDL